jgi:hypothetical protein
MTATGNNKRETDVELLWWLVAMGLEDREQYRELRAVAWALRVERSSCSNIPSETS